jgi:hypothetical protein
MQRIGQPAVMGQLIAGVALGCVRLHAATNQLKAPSRLRCRARQRRQVCALDTRAR